MVSARAGMVFDSNPIGTPILGVDQNGQLAPVRGGADPVATNENHGPSANTDAVLTFDAESGVAHVIDGISFSYGGSGTLSGGNLQIKDGSDVIFSIDISAKEWGHIPIRKQGTPGRAMTITLAAGGANVDGKVNTSHYTVAVGQAGFVNFGDENSSGLLLLFF